MTKAERTRLLRELIAEQKLLKKRIASIPNLTLKSTDKKVNEFLGILYDVKSRIPVELNMITRKVESFTNKINKPGYVLNIPAGTFKIPPGTLSARGWHKDHYNYNKAEKHERTPAKRRTPARNVTRTGAKRIRKTNIKKYK